MSQKPCQVNKQWRQVGLAWSQSNNLARDLILSRLTIDPQTLMMFKQLALSSSDWDRSQIKAELETGKRDYRIVQASTGIMEAAALEHTKTMTERDYADVFPTELCNSKNVSFFFRLLGRSGCALHYYVVRHHKTYPYRLFSLLRLEGDAQQCLAKQILEEYSKQRCCMDGYTLWHLEAHSKELLSDLSLLDLRSAASFAATDIAATECKHAANRRMIQAKSIQTYSTKLVDASSLYLARTLRNNALPKVGFHGYKGGPPNKCFKMKRKRGPQKKKKVNPKASRYAKHLARGQKLRRGGGAWTVFRSENSHALPLTPDGKQHFRELAQKYKDLCPEERQRLKAIADSCTVARKFGNSKIIANLSAKKKKNRAMIQDDSRQINKRAIEDHHVQQQQQQPEPNEVDSNLAEALLPLQRKRKHVPDRLGVCDFLEDISKQEMQIVRTKRDQETKEFERQIKVFEGTDLAAKWPILSKLKLFQPVIGATRDGFSGLAFIAKLDLDSHFDSDSGSSLEQIPMFLAAGLPHARTSLGFDISSICMRSAWMWWKANDNTKVPVLNCSKIQSVEI